MHKHLTIGDEEKLSFITLAPSVWSVGLDVNRQEILKWNIKTNCLCCLHYKNIMIVNDNSSGLYYKSFTSVIYDSNNSMIMWPVI